MVIGSSGLADLTGLNKIDVYIFQGCSRTIRYATTDNLAGGVAK